MGTIIYQNGKICEKYFFSKILIKNCLGKLGKKFNFKILCSNGLSYIYKKIYMNGSNHVYFARP
jgi:hypothetical protein